MATRLEKRKKRNISKWIFCTKIFIFVIIILFVGNFINQVNNTIVELNCMENTNLIYYNNINNNLELFGKSYYLDLQFIKKDF